MEETNGRSKGPEAGKGGLCMLQQHRCTWSVWSKVTGVSKEVGDEAQGCREVVERDLGGQGMALELRWRALPFQGFALPLA